MLLLILGITYEFLLQITGSPDISLGVLTTQHLHQTQPCFPLPRTQNLRTQGICTDTQFILTIHY